MLNLAVKIALRQSPSHPVSLEQNGENANSKKNSCHHPTQWAQDEHVVVHEIGHCYFRSPSHAVGLERTDANLQFCRNLQLPSHAVGLEHTVIDWRLANRIESPSHTVGLELAHLLHHTRLHRKVAIPHSGLKTSPKKLESQNLNPLKIETAHREAH